MTTRTPNTTQNDSRPTRRRHASASRVPRPALLLLLIPALLLFATGTASADEPVKVKEINFEDDRIEGELQAPLYDKTETREIDDLTTLVKSREDFADAMLKDVLEL